MIMKVNKSFFEAGAKQREESVIRYIQNKYKAESNADFFGLNNSAESLRTFVQHLYDRDIYNENIIDRLTSAIVEGSLHPLQCVRLSQIINDPDEDLESEDKEILIGQVLNLQWPKDIRVRN